MHLIVSDSGRNSVAEEQCAMLYRHAKPLPQAEVVASLEPKTGKDLSL
jgi:hypothetical protein